MASSSSSPSLKYDVFLSFRGTDTRDNFVSHLSRALATNKIPMFIDYDLQAGDEISSSLIKAIELSKISVIIFSENYADSRWCLDELVKILDCKKELKQIVIPVFYKVEPTDVRYQTGKFGAAFLQMIAGSKSGKEQEWRDALRDAANLAGCDSSCISSTLSRSDALMVDTIIADVFKKLEMDSNNFYDEPGLFGMNSRIEQIIGLLRIESPEFVMVGIWGMGGIGKTKIAEVVYYNISCQFESCYFIHNVREKGEKREGLDSMRDDLICQLLNVEKSDCDLPYTKERLRRTKVLIVLDDVDDSLKLERVIGGYGTDQFGPGSRVIVTTRDKQILRARGLVDKDAVYKMEILDDNEAFQLFSFYAFRQKEPGDAFLQFSKKMVEYANGVPLALKVLGASLCKQPVEYWDDVLKTLKNVPNLKISDVLKISYDGLDDEVKDIFLDIACFFKGNNINTVRNVLHGNVLDGNVLDGCYFSLHVGITNLLDKSLISYRNILGGVSDSNVSFDEVEMHDLVQEMGWNIVIGESESAGSRSRLWHPQDVYDVLTTNTGTENIKSILFDTTELELMSLAPEAFKKMCKLQFLKIMCSSSESKIQFPSSLNSLPNELKYLYWQNYPLESLPPTFNASKLVELHLDDGNLTRLGDDFISQDLSKLKILSLRSCKNLTEIPALPRTSILQEFFIDTHQSLEDCGLEGVFSDPMDVLANCQFLNLKTIKAMQYIKMVTNSNFEMRLKHIPTPTVSKLCYHFYGGNGKPPTVQPPDLDMSKQKRRAMRSRNAMMEAANRSACDSTNNFYDDGRFVGLNSRMDQIISLLSIESPPYFKMVGIWGTGGIGKTTIAQAVFNKISSEFQSCCFLENVREKAEKEGLASLRDNLISKLLKIKKSASGLPYTMVTLRHTRVLIVLDDVDHVSQLQLLIGASANDEFGPGSRVIVTTKDKQILRDHDIADNDIYDMEILDDNEALQLFSYHAFGQRQPVEAYHEFSVKLVEYTKGVPLALEVLGSSLHKMTNLRHWEGALEKLRNVPDTSISDVLKISYDGLDDKKKNIFLDIACFFRHENLDTVRNALLGTYDFLDYGIEVLLDRSLISCRNITTWDWSGNHSIYAIHMHDLVQEMGWNIVSGESENVGSRSRLWRPEEVHDLLTTNTGTENVKGILFDTTKFDDISLAPETFEKMYNLKFLIIRNDLVMSKIQFPSGLKSLPDGLRYLDWKDYPLEYLPPTFNPNFLNELHITRSPLERLWTGRQDIYSLRAIRLVSCFNLTEIPDLSLAMNLEKLDIVSCDSLVEISSSMQYLKNLKHLNLSGCRGLVEIPSFIQSLDNLISLDLSGCTELERIPNYINCISLTHLNLMGCTNIIELPHLSKNITSLSADGTLVARNQWSIAFFTELVDLKLWNCTDYQKSPAFLNRIKTLTPSNCKILIPNL